MEIIVWLNENIVWGAPMLILFTVTGIIYTARLRFFQFIKPREILRRTIFSKNKNNGGDNTVSPLKTLTAALGTTLGTGNIIAVCAAMAAGGAGAVFWMWTAALIGMATSYAENVLGMKHRERMEDGSYGNVPFAYIKKAFGGKRAGRAAAGIFAACCIPAAFGMGNMAQINSAAVALNNCTGASYAVTGVMCAVPVAYFIAGGLKRLAGITSVVIPVASVGYIAGCTAVILFNAETLPDCFARIFTEAFTFRSLAGGTVGSMLLAVQWGVKRGVFSNEAGLGTSVMIHSESSASDCRTQGMWAALQVFIDTIVMCSMTALCVLSSGADRLTENGTEMALIAFRSVLGDFAGIFLCAALFVFAVSTAAGWWVFGKKSVIYLFGGKWTKLYSILFVVLCFIGAVMRTDAVWEISDLFNGLMAIPNLTSLLILRKEVE